MSNQLHKTELSHLVTSTLNTIDSLLLHPKNKLLLYNRYLLSRISWHLTVCDLSKTWIIQHLDNTVSHCIRKWLDLPITSTLSNILLPREKFGLDIILPATKFIYTVSNCSPYEKAPCSDFSRYQKFCM